MIDFHTHILPGIDDGSRTIEMTEDLLDREADMGVELIALTPHFYAERSSIRKFQTKRDAALEQVQELLEKKQNLPQLIVGAEVSFFHRMSEAEDLDLLCFRGSHLMLLEMPFTQWTDDMYQEVEDLIQRRDRQIILAHIERYESFQKDKGVFRDILELPLYGQCNAAPLLDWRRKRSVLSFFKKGQAKLLGSDCHDPKHRPPNLAEGRTILEKKLGTEWLRDMDATGDCLLKQAGVEKLG